MGRPTIMQRAGSRQLRSASGANFPEYHRRLRKNFTEVAWVIDRDIWSFVLTFGAKV